MCVCGHGREAAYVLFGYSDWMRRGGLDGRGWVTPNSDAGELDGEGDEGGGEAV